MRVDKSKLFEATGYDPHHGQKKVHDCDARFRVVIAGRRWGKSLSAAMEAETEILRPNTRGWIVSKTYDLTKKVIREIENHIVRKRKLKPVVRQMSGPIIMEWSWGSVVEGKSAEHPESLLGEGLDWLIFDECASCKASIWEQYLRPTLTDYGGWALFISTPRGYNWVYDLWKKGLSPDDPDWAAFKFPSWENPHLPKSDIAEAKRTLRSAVFRQEYGADFTISAGQVYEDFDESIHVVPADKLVVDPEWPRYRAIDFGYENPFVCLYIAVDPEDRVIIYDEYVQRHKTTEMHAKAIKRRGGTFEYTVCDPSGAGPRATLLENGITTVALRSLLVPGLDEVRRALRVREDGTPGLYVSSNCAETIKEFNLYSYPDVGGNEEPVKEYDHSMDAVRYFIVNWRKYAVRDLRVRYS